MQYAGCATLVRSQVMENRHLSAARKAVAELERQTKIRDREIIRARADGETWRAISLATGITDHGLRKIVMRAAGTIEPEDLRRFKG